MSTATPQRLIDMYDELLNHSIRMLTWARENRWAALIAEEEKYVSALDRIATAEAVLELSIAERECKQQKLDVILRKNEETYRRLLSRRMELDQLLTESEGDAQGTVQPAFETPWNDYHNSSHLLQ